MEKHIQIFLNKISFAAITIATLTLLLLYLQIPVTCFDPEPKLHKRSPKGQSTCDFTHRTYATVDKRNRRLWSTKAWVTSVSSYSALFRSFEARDYVANHSRVIIVSASPGHAMQALNELGVKDVMAVELVESLPLVTWADPHNLPFFDGVFDLGFGVYLDRALFPKRYVGQIERTVRCDGIFVVYVEECRKDDVMEIVNLFKKSQFVDSKNVILAGESRTGIVMRVCNPITKTDLILNLNVTN